MISGIWCNGDVFLFLFIVMFGSVIGCGYAAANVGFRHQFIFLQYSRRYIEFGSPGNPKQELSQHMRLYDVCVEIL